MSGEMMIRVKLDSFPGLLSAQQFAEMLSVRNGNLNNNYRESIFFILKIQRSLKFVTI